MLDEDIIEGFREETKGLMSELMTVVDGLEEEHQEFPKALVEEFALKIDRIMGTSQTMEQMAPEHKGLKTISNIAGLCKATGYKAIEVAQIPLIPIFAGFWADTIEAVEDLVDALDDAEKTESIVNKFTQSLQGRLTWLAKKVSELKPADGGGDMSQIQVDALLKSFGI